MMGHWVLASGSHHDGSFLAHLIIIHWEAILNHCRDNRIAQLERELAQKGDLTEELKRQKASYIAQIQEANKALSETEVR